MCMCVCVGLLRRGVHHEQVRVVADLAQPVYGAKGLQQATDGAFHFVRAGVLQVDRALMRGQAAEEHLLALLGQLGVDVDLQPAQQVRQDHVSEHQGALVRRPHLGVGCVGVAPEGDGGRKLFFKDGESPQFPWKHEVEQGPQLL